MKRFLLVLLVISFSSFSIAANSKKKKKKNPEFIETNIELSKEVDSIAQEIDFFLSGEKTKTKKNNTTLVLSNRFDWREGGETEFKSHFDVNISLPNLEKKWKLKLSSYDDSAAGRGIEKNRVESTSAQENYGTSIEFLNKWEDYKLVFRPRLQLSPLLGMSYLLRLSKDIKLDKKTTFRPSYSFYAKPEKGTGIFASFNTDYRKTKTRIFTLINEGEYSNFENTFLVNNGLAYRHPIFKANMHMIHSVMLESTNRPTYHLDQIVVSSGYYHKLYFRVFHYAITPYLLFAEENNFKGKFGVRIDANFIF